MLISPPFLPVRDENQSDTDWLNLAMNSVSSNFIPELGNETIAGAYPVSMELGWHGGSHLIAPPGEETTTLPVRAIADGTVIYARRPKAQNRNDDEPLNYGAPAGGSCWTSDGTILIRHETDIGASPDGQAISVVFYSLYMHLDSIAEGVVRNRRIYRKEELGSAGYIYGQPHRIHFEIFCDDENLQRLTGRHSGDLQIGKDGQSSVVFGELYFYLPTGARLYAQRPTADQVTPTAGPIYTTTADLIIGLRYAEGDGVSGQRGDAMMTTYNADGVVEGDPLVEHDAEYNLYTRAKTIAASYPENGRPAPSAAYELLRFGRVINTANETLTPVDVPHWRQVCYPGGRGWVNLNATNVRKFSDADFPQWKGWQLIDDSADQDSRCDSPTIRRWFNTNQDAWVDIAEARDGLSDRALLHKLENTICKFPSEWRGDTIDERWAWLMKPDDENFEALSADDFKAFRAHAQALCFWEKVPAQTPALPDNPWRFHPRRFIQVFRKCGWLSLDELGQLLPRNRLVISLQMAKRRFEQRGNTELNRALRKYGFVNVARQTFVLAQIYIETDLMGTLVERGQGAFNSRIPMTQYYAAFYGRGMVQLTWPDNYAKYGNYRALPNHTGAYADSRITATSTHDWAAPTLNKNKQLVRDQRRWSPRYDPAIIASDTYNAADSVGYYWVQKHFTGTSNMHRLADEAVDTEHVGKASILINGGGFGYNERLQYAAYIERYRGDGIETALRGTIQATRQTISHGHWVTSGGAYSLNVDYTPQRA